MGFQCGIVGLPNVGKSTIFNALTSAKAEAANFPFCTIEPNTGIVRVPDPRLFEIEKHIPTEKVIPAQMVFVDIAGLVKGASQGEGLGNQFLGHIRETRAIAHVVRCFDDSNVVHVDGSVDPIRDIEVIDTELILADLETVTKRFQSLQKRARTGDRETLKVFGLLETLKKGLEEGKPARQICVESVWSEEQMEALKDLHLITLKKVMYIANVGEDSIGDPDQNPYVQMVKKRAESEGAVVVVICGKIESEISELDAEEKIEFLKDYQMTEPGLHRVVRAGYELLDLQTYFTAGEKEIRAWTIQRNCKAPQAAGVIHSDFERGFIRAEVYHYNDLIQHGSESAIRDAGALRLEGKEYIVKDGDVIHFRFNV